MNLHPYDGVERRFRHTDATTADGLAIVARVLHVPAARSALYDMRFYSGGFGIIDYLAIALPVNDATAAEIVMALGLAPPDGDTAELVVDEDAPEPLADAIAHFVDEHRCDFQPPCRATDRVWFEPESNSNHWVVVWHRDRTLCYVAYDRG
jgi:hypothetical protein